MSGHFYGETKVFYDENLDESYALLKTFGHQEALTQITNCRLCPKSVLEFATDFQNPEALVLIASYEKEEIMPFTPNGQRLRALLSKTGLTPDHVYLTSAIQCHGSQDAPSCNMHLLSLLMVVRPLLVIFINPKARAGFFQTPISPGYEMIMPNLPSITFDFQTILTAEQEQLLFNQFKYVYDTLQAYLKKR